MNAPLTDRDYAEVRARVMREIRMPVVRRSPVAGRRSPWLIGAAAAAIVAFAFVFLFTPSKEVARVKTIAPQARQFTPTTTATGDRRPANASKPVLTAGSAHARRHRAPHTQVAHTQVAVRMQIQTADPTVRIIWIAQ